MGHVLRRLAAALVDFLAISIATVVVALVIGIVLGMAGASEAEIGLSGQVVFVVVFVAYFASLEHGAGTLGKAMVGLAVSDGTGARPGVGRAVLRQVAKSVLFWTVPLAAFGQVPLHDLIAGTRVVKS